MKYLVFDTETTDLVNKVMPLDHVDQPWPVQISAGLFEWPATEFKLSMAARINIVLDVPVASKPKAYETHGISKPHTEKFGLKPITGLTMFLAFMSKVEIVVAHNMEYDREIIEILQRRLIPNHGNPFAGKKLICTKEMATPVLNLPPTQRMRETGFGNKPKSPTLSECMFFFTGDGIPDAHDAEADMMACARVFFEIIGRNGPEAYGVKI